MFSTTHCKLNGCVPSMTSSSATPRSCFHACMTNASLTAMHATVSTPFALNDASSLAKPGRCCCVQPGVNGPGTAKRATVLPANTSDVDSIPGAPSTMVKKVDSGRREPTAITGREGATLLALEGMRAATL